MALNNRKLLIFLSAIWILSIFVLGIWWLYLIVDLSNHLSSINTQLPNLTKITNYLSMAKWEGSFFFLLLLLVSSTLGHLYLKDVKRSKALGAFLASVTHELKTPLASIRLQSDVIHELLHDKLGDQEQTHIHHLYDRLVEDTQNLEIQLDKVLQLSRLESRAELNHSQIDLLDFIQNHMNTVAGHDLQFVIDSTTSSSHIIYGDEYALKVILNNLIENTKKHNLSPNKKIRIELSQTEKGNILLKYDDHGESFNGEIKNLGKLFYKYNSPKGSGIGLYIIRKLMVKMQGQFKVMLAPHDSRPLFHLTFTLAKVADSN